MKRVILIVWLIALLSIEVLAGEKVKIGDLYYELPFYGSTATVTYKGKYWGNSPYKGNVVIPEKVHYKGNEYVVNKIGDGAFYNCRQLTSITIPNSVEVIDGMAFDQCFALTTIHWGNKVKRIGRTAFSKTNLSKVEVPVSVKYIGPSAFAFNRQLISVTVPEDADIADDAFQYTSADVNTYAGKPYVAKKKETTPPTPPTQVDPKALPILDIISGSLAFVDATGRNVIGANSKYSVRFQLKNSGKGSAKGCTAKLTGKGATNGLVLKDFTLPEIAVGETKTITVPLTTNLSTVDGEVELAIQVDEPNGFGTDPQYITVKTRAFEAPLVQVTDYSLTADGGTTLRKKVPFDLQLLVQNTKHGQADDVQVSIEIPQNVLMIEGREKEQFSQLAGGEAKSLVYSLIVNNNYAGTTIPVKVHVKEKYGKYAEDRAINLQLDQAMASTKIAVEARQQQPKGDVAVARLGSDVDKDLPQAAGQQQKTFVVIIANERYQTVESVPFAQNDGQMFEAYCRQTLGIPQQNIHTVSDATLNGMKYQVDWLRQVMEAYNGEARAIVYYAGHGIPNEQDQTSYLLPVDGYVGNTSSAYSLSEFYRTLGSLPARSVTVFLDACFSGTKRDGQMLASARGVAIKAKASTPQGNMIVFSAAQGDETAYPYQDQHHGMFTYYILKKLKDSKGNATLGSLSDYVSQEVKRQSIVLNGKMQTPTVNASASLAGSWRQMKLKE